MSDTAVLAEILNELDPGAGVSALALSYGELLARLVNVVDADADASSLTQSHAALLAQLHNAVVDGAPVSNLTASSGQMLAGIINALGEGGPVSPLTTSADALFEAAMALVGAGAGGGGAYPAWLPQAPSGDRPLVYADFAHEHYWANGAEVAFEDLFEEILDWGPFTGLTGQGLTGSSNAIAIINPLGADLIASAFTTVVTYVSSDVVDGGFSIVAIDISTWEPDYELQVNPAYFSTIKASGSSVENPERTGELVVGVHRSACTFDGASFAAADDGSTVYTAEDVAPTAVATRIIIASAAGSNSAWMTSVAFYAKQPQVDLPALTAGGGFPAPPEGFAYVVNDGGDYVVNDGGAFVTEEI